MTSPDTGAGTPHVFDHEGTARHHHHDQTGDPVWWLGCEQFGGDRREHQHAARSRPATDPAGLDAALRKYFRAVDDIRDAGEARMGDPTLIARMYRDAGERKREAEAILRARLSVDGPGPDATVLVEDQERPLIWVDGPARLEPARLWQLALAKSIDGLVVGDTWEAAAAIKGRLDSRGVVLAVDPTARDALAARMEVDRAPEPEYGYLKVRGASE